MESNVKGVPYEELERNWAGMLRRFASWRVPGCDYDDLYQELRLVLWRAQKSYDPLKGAAFTTFLYRACVNRVGKLLHQTEAQKRVPAKLTLQLCDGNHDPGAGSYRSPCPVCRELPSTELDTEAFELLSTAPTEAQRLAGLVLYGYTTKREWLAAGLTAEQVKKGIDGLREAIGRRAK